MSLAIDSSSIKIHNASGTVKFDSSSKLVYQKYFKTGTVTVTGDEVSVPFYNLSSTDFVILSVKITACTGNTGSSLIGVEIPANGSIVTHFQTGLYSTTPYADVHYLGVNLIEDLIKFNTVFKQGGMQALTSSTISTTLTYKATIYSYL